jgi:hypothetical protein
MAIKAIQESTSTILRDLTPSLSIIAVPPHTKIQNVPDGAYRLCVGVRLHSSNARLPVVREKGPDRATEAVDKLTSRAKKNQCMPKILPCDFTAGTFRDLMVIGSPASSPALRLSSPA